jgi:DNA (cytosine-5)-methyltransferase 1
MIVSENTVAEYFAGIGLMRLGLEAAGWRVVFANDISPRKRAMYAAAFPNDAHFHPGDIFLLDHNLVPSATLATCSFPCTDLSLAGNYAGLAGRASSAFRGWIEILQAQGDAAPPLVLLENVVGWLSSNKGQDFRLTIKALNDLGYACDVFTLNALHFVPQSRPRVFVVGSRRHMPAASIVPALARSPALISPRLKQTLQDNSDLCWLWLDIPEPPPLHTAGLAAIIEPDQRWWADADIARHLAHRLSVARQPVYLLSNRISPDARRQAAVGSTE